jgi:hypothetical protein
MFKNAVRDSRQRTTSKFIMKSEWRVAEKAEGKSHGLILGTGPAFTWRMEGEEGTVISVRSRGGP